MNLSGTIVLQIWVALGVNVDKRAIQEPQNRWHVKPGKFDW